MSNWLEDHVSLRVAAISILVLAIVAIGSFAVALTSYINSKEASRSSQSDFNARLCEVIPETFSRNALLLTEAVVASQMRSGATIEEVTEMRLTGEQFAIDVKMEILESLQPCPVP